MFAKFATVFMAMVLGLAPSLAAQCVLPQAVDFDALTIAPVTNCGTTATGTYPVGWALEASSTNAWRVWTGATASTATGPNGDHTSGFGNYLYTEASCTGSPWVATLELPCFDVSSLALPTLEFWFHLYGTGIGSLEVLEFDGQVWNSVWTTVGDQGDQWILASVALSPVMGESRLRIRGTSGSAFTGDLAIDDVMVGNPTPALWQTNRPAANLSIDGQVITSPFTPNPAIVNRVAYLCGGTSAVPVASQLQLSTNQNGAMYEIALCDQSLFPVGSGGLIAPNTQIINVDFLNPTLTWFHGGATAQFQALPGIAFPGAQGVAAAINFMSNTTVDLSAQAIFSDPTASGGYSLSQGIEYHVAVSTSQPTRAGPTASNAVTTIDITAPPFCWTTSGMPFFGTSYTELHVISNGRVMFGPMGDTSSTPTIAEALVDDPFVGLWTDLGPDPIGTVLASDLGGGVIRVDWINIPYAVEPLSPRFSFGVQLDSNNGVVSIDGLAAVPVNPISSGVLLSSDSIFLGISGGNALGATDNGVTSFAPGLSGTPTSSTDMIYDFFSPLAAGVAGLPGSLSLGSLSSVVFTPAGASYAWAGF